MSYEVELSADAQDHLRVLEARDRTIVIDTIEEQLTHDPAVPTRRRKLLRENPLAAWELRIGDFRVFYNVEDERVLVVAVGLKEHNRLHIAGEEFEL